MAAEDILVVFTGLVALVIHLALLPVKATQVVLLVAMLLTTAVEEAVVQAQLAAMQLEPRAAMAVQELQTLLLEFLFTMLVAVEAVVARAARLALAGLVSVVMAHLTVLVVTVLVEQVLAVAAEVATLVWLHPCQMADTVATVALAL